MATVQKRICRHFILALIAMVMFVGCSHGINEGQLSSYLRGVFRDESGRQLNQMVVSNESGTDFVYLGGITMLYQLDMNLTLLQQESTAPDPCPSPCLHSTKILEVAPSPISKLIQCGGPEGKCELRSLTDISRDFGYTLQPVVNDGMSVGVVAVRQDVEGLGKVFLYVATSIGPELSSNSDVPITHRTLDHPTELLIFQYTYSIRINEPLPPIPGVHVDYIQGVSWNHFNFWIVHNGAEQSKLGRICSDTTEDDLGAYAEIILSCESRNTLKSVYIDLNDVLYGIFTDGTNSVLCSYTMSEIQERFLDAVCGCVISDDSSCTGQGQIISYLDDPKCSADTFSGETRETLKEDHLCENLVGRNKYVEATNPLEGNLLAADLPGQHSSIITLSKEDQTVALVTTSSTSNATLSKIHVESNSEPGRLYETVTFDVGGMVLHDVYINQESEDIFILTNAEVMKLAVVNCSQYTTCSECNEVGDPFCGWCTLENKCSRSSECSNPDGDSSKWLQYNQDCIAINDLDPPSQEINSSPVEVSFSVSQLPFLEANSEYTCQFDDVPTTTSMNGNNFTCMTPAESARPPLPDGDDYVTMTLGIASPTNVIIVEEEYPFFRCSAIKSCTECVSSDWGCNWCIYSSTCTLATSCTSDDTSDIIVVNSDAASCPRLDVLSTEILIPVGLNRPIYLTGTNLPTGDGTSYSCVLSYMYINDGSEFRRVGVMSDVTNTSVECQPTTYDYPSSFGVELEFNIRVEYKPGVSVDNLNNTVTLFKCAVNELSCRSCVTTVVRKELGCGWCLDTCQVNETCNGDFLPRGESDRCPPPKITSIYPTAGPLEGNTTMTINGTNLAAEFNETVNITVGGIPCSAIDENFVPGLSINCRTGSANNSLEGGVTVVFEFGTASGGNFIYRDPIVSGFTPFTGIRSGGTKMNISGEDLDTGRVIEVFVGNAPCTIKEESISSELLKCTTSESPETGNSSVIVSFDGTEKEVPGVYVYVDDPDIEDYEPKQSIMSGGIRMSVKGSGFSTVQSVQLELTSGEEVIYQECSKNTSELIYCLTPDLNNSTLGSTSRRRRQVTDILVGIAFILDGLRSDWDTGLTVSPDPVYEVLEAAYVVKSLGELVTLRGTNLNVPDKAEDFVTVCFGKGKCEVTTVTETELTCLSPEYEPEGGVCKENDLDLPIDDNNDINIVVFHGEAIGQYLGIASYDTGGSIVALIVGATVGGVVALSIIIFLVFVTVGHRNYRAQIKNTELEMQNLMQQSRREVMEGFFIDQEMTDIEEQLSGLGMPFVSNHDYMKSMLFFGLDVKPHESDPQNPSNEEEMAMLEFSKLLGNKDFLIIFIKALDSSRQITTKEKANIASLLTVVLVMERKFRYFTDVLMTLMSDTIGEAADRQRLKQLFKRTESLEDKMLNNWIALAMFQSIKETSGQPLYMLYQAIKIQCEKGPVDAMTGKSFFSLNFDNLLTESQDFEELTLNVESEIGQEPVKVLNVDTITQVKEKILDAMYRKKHTKYQRSAREVDLVLRSGNAGELVISDYDTSTQPSMGWCAINTLQHYGISSGTQVSLTNKTDMPNALPVPMNNDANNLFTLFPEFHKYSKDDASRTSVRVAGHHDYHSHDLENGPQDIRYYHLVQTEDIDEQDQEIDEGFCAKMQRTLCFKGTQGRRKIREIYLQRLVSVKQSINNFVDSALEAMFSIREDEYVNNLTNIPFALRFLFNFFDEESSRYEDDGTAATWKNNILPLRFWSTILAHPSFIFNMRQSRTADASVVVLNQMLDNACKGVVPTLKMNSSPSRLLFNKELPDHITLLTTYYHNIKQTPILQEAELKVECKRIDDEFTGLFSRLATLRQLYERIRPHETRLIEALQDDERCSQAHFASSLERVGNTLDQPED